MMTTKKMSTQNNVVVCSNGWKRYPQERPHDSGLYVGVRLSNEQELEMFASGCLLPASDDVGGVYYDGEFFVDYVMGEDYAIAGSLFWTEIRFPSFKYVSEVDAE